MGPSRSDRIVELLVSTTLSGKLPGNRLTLFASSLSLKRSHETESYRREHVQPIPNPIPANFFAGKRRESDDQNSATPHVL